MLENKRMPIACLKQTEENRTQSKNADFGADNSQCGGTHN